MKTKTLKKTEKSKHKNRSFNGKPGLQQPPRH